MVKKIAAATEQINEKQVLCSAYSTDSGMPSRLQQNHSHTLQ